jgi:2-oxoisovalerate dehydrogenase E1 component
MARELFIDPTVRQSRSELGAPAIAINSYQPDLDQERERFGDEKLASIARDMMLIREFELMLDNVKRQGSYLGVEYVHLGPAHLSIGQEAAAVGQSFTLSATDKVFGSHRSHGEVLAKGLSAISSFDETALTAALAGWGNGETWDVVSRSLDTADPEQKAINYLLYGMTAETFGRKTGFNRGLGGSMHAFFPPLGIYPNNAIVGGSGPLATGAALYNRLQNEPGIVVASVGDAATGTGQMWESFSFSSMGQLHTLMDEAHRGGLPIVFFIVNNFYGMGGQPIGETMGFDFVSRMGAGVNPQAMHAQTVDGTNPLAVIDAMARAREIIERGEGPVLIDCQTYRQSGHSPSDASSYRSKEEVEAWNTYDPLRSYLDYLIDGGVIAADAETAWKTWAENTVRGALVVAIDDDISPRLSLRVDPGVPAAMTYNNEVIDLDQAPPGETLVPLHELPHWASLQLKERSGLQGDTVLGGAKAITFRDALFEALVEHFARDNRLAAWGEENRDWGGAFGVYRGLTEFLPRHRLFNAPISEATIVGAGVGFALSGGRAVVELMYADFIGRAGDELFNQMAKWQAMSGGLVQVPLVVRVSIGAKYGAQHSQDWSSMVAGVPGLKVAFPATARDAKGMLASALSSNDPVVFFESQRLYDAVETLHPEGVPREYYRTPVGVPQVVKLGKDLTILSLGATLGRALEAASQMEQRHGLSVEVIDARWMVPFDYTLLIESVQKTGRLLCVSDANLRGSWLNTVATRVTQEAFDDLDAPVCVVGARNWIAPPAELEWDFFPTTEDIMDAVHERIIPLQGHVPQAGPSAAGTLRESALGI